MPVPIARDADTTRDELTKWLAQTLDDVDDVELTRLDFGGANGYSNETIIFDASWRAPSGAEQGEFVARVKPTGYSIFPDYDLLMQARVMDILARDTASPVPARDRRGRRSRQPARAAVLRDGADRRPDPGRPSALPAEGLAPRRHARAAGAGVRRRPRRDGEPARARLARPRARLPRPHRVRPRRHRAAGRDDRPTVRLGARRPHDAAARRRVGVVAGERARRPEGRPQLGRLPARQPHVPRLRARWRSSTGRW